MLCRQQVPDSGHRVLVRLLRVGDLPDVWDVGPAMLSHRDCLHGAEQRLFGWHLSGVRLPWLSMLQRKHLHRNLYVHWRDLRVEAGHI
jgi:hypothetical protein